MGRLHCRANVVGCGIRSQLRSARRHPLRRSTRRSSPRSTACSATTLPRPATLSPSRCGCATDGAAARSSSTEALRAALPASDAASCSCWSTARRMNDLQWSRQGHDHGAALARDLGCTPLYLHYNSGLHVSTNGRELAALLERAGLRVAGTGRRARAARPQHGRARGAQRVPLRRAWASARVWRRQAHEARLPRHAAPWRAARTRRQWLEVLLGVSRYSAPLARLGNPQRGRHRPALRQRARRALAGARPLRAQCATRATSCAARRASSAMRSRHHGEPRAGEQCSSATDWSRSTARSAATTFAHDAGLATEALQWGRARRRRTAIAVPTGGAREAVTIVRARPAAAPC